MLTLCLETQWAEVNGSNWWSWVRWLRLPGFRTLQSLPATEGKGGGQGPHSAPPPIIKGPRYPMPRGQVNGAKEPIGPENSKMVLTLE